jgi:lipopolysaccharide biosynthesis regulator YciM
MKNDAERILGLDELAGLSGLGMEREALSEARRTLKSRDMTSDDFNNALNIIHTHADKCKPWTPVVEAAYERLQKRDKQAVRRSMLYFYCSSRNHEAASKYIPRRFAGEFDITELAFTCETWLELKRMDELDKLAKKLSRTFKVAKHPSMLPHLKGYLGEYYARKGLWNKAVELWESVQLDNIHCQSAVESIVEIHVAGALLAIKRGLELVEKFSREIDSQMETTLPGNDKKIQQQAEKKFRKLKKILEKIAPEKRQKELGLDNKSE